jgi:Flp pilus assembly protein TadB
MKSAGVTVTGLLVFMLFTSAAVALFTILLMGSTNIFVIASVICAIFYLETTLFKLASVGKYEKREAEIMDAVDLLVSYIKSGVYNAIIRYKDSFHPDIKPYFLEFIDDVQNKGYGFKQAMLLLNDRLGMTFTEFAHKAILYEEKADKTMDDIFSSIIEVNRQRRSLRYINNIEFANLRTQFLVSFAAIIGYAIMSMFIDSWIRSFLFSSGGIVMIVVDIIIVTVVLNYMAVIKSKSL